MVPDANELFRAFGVGDELTPPSLPPRPPGSNPSESSHTNDEQ